MKEFLTKAFLDIGVVATNVQIHQFIKYYELLTQYEQANLTAIKKFEEVVIKHFVDSVSIIKLEDSLQVGECHTVIDIGTGAGFPGLPVKIMFPNIKMTLLDSLKKRIDFLDIVIKELGLENVSAIHGRAEDSAKVNRECFDLAVSRAVADFRIVAELVMPFIKVGGSAVLYRGMDETDYGEYEKELRYLGGKVEEIKRFDIDSYGRTLVLINKETKTPSQIPRKAGIAFKRRLNVH